MEARAKLAVLAALLAAGARAATPWFDAGIAGYASWPSDGRDLAVPGAGTWRGTGAAALAGEAGARRLEVEGGELELALEQPRAPEESAGVSTEMRVAFREIGELPEADQTLKGALAAARDASGDARYFGLARDAAGGTNAWTRLDGAVPDPAREVAARVSLRRADGGFQVRYAVDGAALTAGGAEWLALAWTDGAAVSSAGVSGAVGLAALSGEVDAESARVALTFAEVEGLVVVSVTSAGETVTPDPETGAYAVYAGAQVTVTFAAADGYRISGRVRTFTAGAEDIALAAGDLPAPSPGEDVFINEIMASNETSLKTAGGVAGLDWIEIRNTGDTDVDLAAEGWRMTDDPTKKFSKWAPVEGRAVVPAGGFLIVWADKDFADWHADDAHVALGLAAGGEAACLAKPSGHVASSVAFGQQFKDVSYGLGHLQKTVLDAWSDAAYRVGEDGAWHAVKGPVGMSAAAGGFQVVTYRFNTSSVNSVSDARAYIADPAYWSAPPATNTCPTVNFNQGNTVQFPCTGFPAGGGDCFALAITGTLEIPRAGRWTFAVGSDDGFTATLSRGNASFTWEHAGTRGHGQTYSAFTLEAGAYDLDMVYFESGGGNSVELSCCEGDVPFDAARFALAGDEASGVLHAGAFAAKIAADVSDEMAGRDAPLAWRAPFTLPAAPAAGDAYRLRIRYADGFTAKVNGETFASAPATGARKPVEALAYAYWTIPAALLRAGENVLEVTGFNDRADDTEFFLSPEVLWYRGEEEMLYFPEPTPGAANGTPGRQAPTPQVGFSVPHGWKTEPFDLALACGEPGAAIHYTLDGTSPTVFSPRYEGPIRVAGTTAVRAAVPNVDSILQQDTSATYLFVEDVVRQDENPPPGFPASLAVNGQKMRYGMAQNIVDGEDAARLRAGFTNSVFTLSLVIDPANLFDAATGIYVNATGDGRTWERQTLVEQIDPARGAENGFSVPAGLRIRGAYSRGSDKAKHSLRLFFRSSYGMGKLAFPLFGDEGADEFQKVDLRTSQNYSWSNENNDDDTFIHECFSRDTQRDMGEPYTRSRYYNLFINGVYWGLYQTEERVDGDFAASYGGGDAADYDTVRTSQPGYVTGVVEGDPAGWRDFWDLAVNGGFAGDNAGNYLRAQGLNPDGTRNPAYPVYLDPRNLMAYMLVSHYAGDTDCPSMGGGDKPNNICAYWDRTSSGGDPGFHFLRHDAEHSLQGDGRNQNTTLLGTEAWTYTDNGEEKTRYDDIRQADRFGPAELNYLLLQHPDYRMALADLFYREVLRPGGALTLEKASARFMSRMDELDDAIVCEAARWGHNDSEERGPGFTSDKTRATWRAACARRLNFITNRVTYLKRQYQQRGWYPTVDVPKLFTADGGQAGAQVADGARLPEGTALRFSSVGTVYFTADGSDPRAPGGDFAAGARTGDPDYVAQGTVTYAFRALRNGEWSALERLTVTGETAAQADNLAYLRFAAFCGIPADSADGDENEWIVLTNLSASAALDVGGVRVVAGKEDDLLAGKAARCDFTLPEGAAIPAGGALLLEQAAFAAAGWEKITNNKLLLYLYNNDAAATCVQSARAVQKDHPTVYGAGGPGGGASLVATAFGAETGAGDWRASYTLPADAAGAEAVTAAIAADSRVGAWLDALVRADAAKQAEITAFAGTRAALDAAYLVNLGAVRDPEAALRFTGIAAEGEGPVLLDGDLNVLGRAWREKVNGRLRLYRYREPGGTPDVIDLDLPDGRFPLLRAPGADAGTYRFFRLVLE